MDHPKPHVMDTSVCTLHYLTCVGCQLICELVQRAPRRAKNVKCGEGGVSLLLCVMSCVRPVPVGKNVGKVFISISVTN